MSIACYHLICFKILLVYCMTWHEKDTELTYRCSWAKPWHNFSVSFWPCCLCWVITNNQWRKLSKRRKLTGCYQAVDNNPNLDKSGSQLLSFHFHFLYIKNTFHEEEQTWLFNKENTSKLQNCWSTMKWRLITLEEQACSKLSVIEIFGKWLTWLTSRGKPTACLCPYCMNIKNWILFFPEQVFIDRNDPGVIGGMLRLHPLLIGCLASASLCRLLRPLLPVAGRCLR